MVKTDQLDDNLMLALGKLPEGERTGQSMKGLTDEIEKLEAFKSLGQAIFKSARVSISAAAKAVVPSIPKAIGEITQEIERGPVYNFDKSLNKLNNLVNNLGVNLEDYNKKLADFLKEREEKIVESEKRVEQLKIQNVVSEVNRITGEVNILSKKEIDEKKKNVEYLTKLIAQEEKALNKNTKVLQEKKGLSDKEIASRKEFIKKGSERLQDLKEQRDYEVSIVGESKPSFASRIFGGDRGEDLGGGGRDFSADRYIPAPLMDIFSSIKEGFMAPLNAVKEIGSSFMEFAKPLRLVVDLFKPLLGFLKKFVIGLMSSVVAFLPFIAIGAVISAALYGLYLAVKKVAGFFGFGKEAREKEKIDKQQGTGKFQSLDEGTFDVMNEGMEVDNKGASFVNEYGVPKAQFSPLADQARQGRESGSDKLIVTKRGFSKQKYNTRKHQGDPISPEELQMMREAAGMKGNTIINAPTQQVNQNSTNNLPSLEGSNNGEIWYNRSQQSSF